MQHFDDLPEHALAILELFRLNILRIDMLDGIYEVELDGNSTIDLLTINAISNIKQFRMVSETYEGNLLVFIDDE